MTYVKPEKSGRKTKRFTRGQLILTIDDLARDLMADRWVFLRDTPKHPKVMLHMSMKVLIGFVQAEQLSQAIDSQEKTT